MALYPEGDKLDAFPSRYILANLAARRAKQIKDGAPILVQTTSVHPLTIALEEIADGAVKPIMVQGELVPQAVETLESIDLLAKEAAGFDTGFGDFGFLSGDDLGAGARKVRADATGFEGGAITEPAGEFDEETISLDDLLDAEEAGVDADEDSLDVLADLPDPSEMEDVEEDEALLD